MRAFYVFGSYARGALNPGDLDVLVVHENPGENYWRSLRAELRNSGKDFGLSASGIAFKTRMLGGLQRRGEHVHVTLTQSINYVLERDDPIRKDLVLLWTPEDQDFQSKLAAIKADSAAGRAKRDHFVNLRRLNASLDDMEKVVQWINRGVLILTRVPFEAIDIQLAYTYCSEFRWNCRLSLGRESIKILPYAMWWLRQHRQWPGRKEGRIELWSKSWTHRVDVGKPSLSKMMWIFEESPKIRRQCLIPHLRTREPNDLLVFERGPQWKNRRRKELYA